MFISWIFLQKQSGNVICFRINTVTCVAQVMDFTHTSFDNFRDEIAGCSEKAYNYLSIADAKKILMFSSDQELHEYITEVV